MATQIFPLEVWTSQITQASIPANENALRVQVIEQPALDILSAQPVGVEDDIYIVGSSPTGAQWSTFDEGDVAIFKGGTWLAFSPFLGWAKYVSTDLYVYDGAAWALVAGGPESQNWKYLKLTSDFSTSSTSYVDVPELDFPITAGKQYEVEVFGKFDSGATGKGIGIQLKVPTGSDVIGLIQQKSNSGLYMDGNWQNSATNPGSPFPTSAAAVSIPIQMRHLFVANANGFSGIRVRSSSTSSPIVLKSPNFILKYRAI